MSTAEVALPSPKVDKEPRALTRSSFGAFKWNLVGSLVRVLAQFLIGVLLARMLGPEPFGLVAIAWLLLGLGNLIADFGLTAALVQRAAIGERDIRYVFTLQMLAGIFLTVIVVGMAPFVAGFFNRPDAEPVLKAMALVFVFQACGQTASALLRREMNFRAVQVASVTSYIVGFLVVGLPLAWGGFGVWALVGAQLSQSVLGSVMLLLQRPHAMLPILRPEGRGMLSFGSGVLAGNLTSWSISNLDAAIVGRLIGVTELGLYNRSMNLVATPMNAFVSALQGVLFSAYARAQADTDSVRRAYLASLGGVAVTLVPAFSALAAVPHTAVSGIYGTSWLAATPLLAPLALAMPVNALLALGGPLLLGLGKAGQEAGAQALGAFVLIAAVWLAAGFSLAAVAWAVLGVYVLRMLLVSRLAIGLCGASWVSVGQALAGPTLLGVLAAGTAAWIDALLVNRVHATLRLAVDLGLSATVCILFLLLFGRYLLGKETISILAQGTGRLPVYLARHIARWERRQ